MSRKSILFACTLGLPLLINLAPVQVHGAGLSKNISNSHGWLSAKWWQYITSFPASESPQDAQGEFDCTEDQRGPVIFLAGANPGTTAVRSCTVPRRSLFFPVLNILFDNAPGEEPLSVGEKRVVVDEFLSDTAPGFLADLGFPGTRACEISATLDGEPINFFSSIVRTQSPPFQLITGPDGNPPNANDPEAVSDGFWILLSPLSRGEHTLRFSGRFCEFNSFDDHPLFGPVDVTYDLTVE